MNPICAQCQRYLVILGEQISSVVTAGTLREVPRDKFVAYSCALSSRELPPLQSGHCRLMFAINVAFGADGVTSMRKEAFSGSHAPDSGLWALHSTSLAGSGPVMSRQYLPGWIPIIVKFLLDLF
jgi:hypothetical protein